MRRPVWLASRRQQLLELVRCVRLALAVGHHDLPAFARKHPRLGDNEQAAFPLRVDFHVLAFCDHSVGHLFPPYFTRLPCSILSRASGLWPQFADSVAIW